MFKMFVFEELVWQGEIKRKKELGLNTQTYSSCEKLIV